MSAAATAFPIPGTRSAAAQSKGQVLPLEAGDRLTRAEFHRRYLAMPGVKKAELVEGIVYLPSPVKLYGHGVPHGNLMWWLKHYSVHQPKTEAGDNSTLLLDVDNEAQPDAFLRIRPEFGGQSRTSEDDYIEGAPELLAEVASPTASYDLHAKKNAYRRKGVQEYVVWLTRENQILWWRLVEGEFVAVEADATGIFRSQVFPGLWLDTAAMLEGDLAAVLAKLQEGLATAEAKAFRDGGS